MLSLAVLLARAGGGQNFGGGGGGGGGGIGGGGIGGGGGGGFFFFGGNGAGGGAIGVVVFLVLAVLLFVGVVALRGARGRGRIISDDSIAESTAGAGSAGSGGGVGGVGRPSGSGGSGGSGYLTEKEVEGWGRPTIPDLGVHLPGSAFPGGSPGGGQESVQAGLDAIRAHDPAFDDTNFLAEVQRAFFVVEEAWTDLKPEMSRRVMADGLWQQHRMQIEQYVNQHKRNVLENLSVGDATIISAHTDQSYDTVLVRFLAACADYDIDTDNQKVVRGNKRVGQWQEDWTFQRSASATTKPGGGTFSEKCPNCGAPLTVDLQGVCHYCKAPVMSGDYDWVLARISQVG